MDGWMDIWVVKQQPPAYKLTISYIFRITPFSPTLSTLSTVLHVIEVQQMFVDDDVDCGLKMLFH